MGFNLTIGELSYEVDEEGTKCPCVHEVKHAKAPRDGSPTDGTNKRWPSYTAWGDFCDFIEIDPDFFIPEHPGYRKIDDTFKHLVDKAYKKFHGKSKLHDGRLEWLHYWTCWAFKKCKQPVLLNT